MAYATKYELMVIRQKPEKESKKKVVITNAIYYYNLAVYVTLHPNPYNPYCSNSRKC